VLACLAVGAQPKFDEGKVTEVAGFTDLVAALAVGRQGLLEVVGGLLVAALQEARDAEVAQRAGFAGLVAGLAVDRQGLLEAVGGLLVAALPKVDNDEALQCFRFSGAVTGLARSSPGVVVDGNDLGIVAASLEVSEQGGSQAGGVARPAAGGGVRGDSGQNGPFSI
jgi:hypothetical protein